MCYALLTNVNAGVEVRVTITFSTERDNVTGLGSMAKRAHDDCKICDFELFSTLRELPSPSIHFVSGYGKLELDFSSPHRELRALFHLGGRS